ncbi:MAG TPA: hypothetical protein VLK30_03210 [Candidatus Limnocylindrales bacterium]|nr:hypothetical protein [Candidatus Limnocylindrales bacterium]
MNKRPGHVDVTTEVGYCNFCGRTRNLRSEEHHLGTFVRTIVTCETCHRTLSSTMGVAQPDTAEAPQAPAPAATEPAVEAVKAKREPAAKAATAKKAATARKPGAGAKAKTSAKTPTRRTSTKKK